MGHFQGRLVGEHGVATPKVCRKLVIKTFVPADRGTTPSQALPTFRT
jgi:hypothetical protein